MLSVEEFVYELPEASIAQTPCEPRDAARLLDAIAAGPPAHRHVRDLPGLIGPGDVIVVNDTRVIRARLVLAKQTGGAVEVMLLEPDADSVRWKALVRPSRRVQPGTLLVDATGSPVVQVGDDLGDGVRLVEALDAATVLDLAQRLGSVPLPPYITVPLNDPDRYQTVYARNERSVAAPTAGLHFTPVLLDQCRTAGTTVLSVELAVGLGTFRPIMVDDVRSHQMHAERYRVPASVIEACRDANRVVAVGTTTVRALESAAKSGELEGATELFISPGYEFDLVDVLLTNFHQPRSSLLVMLAAFAGPRWRELYDEARHENYRFLSFGDAMIVGKQG